MAKEKFINDIRIEKNKQKIILDACCGGRMMWFNKHHPNTIYIDNRSKTVWKNSSKKPLKGTKTEIKPDIVMDFRDLKFENNTFNLVVMDPPHLKSLKPDRSNMIKDYGFLNPETWQRDLKRGLKECMRVLKPKGVLIFKWNDCDIKFKEIMKIFPFEPLFYNISSGKMSEKRSNTAWFCFMKLHDT